MGANSTHVAITVNNPESRSPRNTTNPCRPCVSISRGRRVLAGKCRRRGIESNSDPRNLPARDENRRQQRPVRQGGDQVGTAPAFASVGEAMDMVRAGLGYLAAADAAQLPAATQAQCLRELEQADAVATAARASMLAGFTAGQGYAGDAVYSARAWL